MQLDTATTRREKALEVSEERRAALARAKAGDLLTPGELALIFRIGRQRFYTLQKAGAFDAFKVKPAGIGYARYSGVLVQKVLDGENPTLPERVFAGRRRP